MIEIQRLNEAQEEINKQRELKKKEFQQKYGAFIKKEEEVQEKYSNEIREFMDDTNQAIIKNLRKFFDIQKDVQEHFNTKTTTKLLFIKHSYDCNHTTYFLEIIPPRHTTKRTFSLNNQRLDGQICPINAKYKHGTSTADLIIPGLSLVVKEIYKLKNKLLSFQQFLDDRNLRNKEYREAYEAYLKSFQEGNIRKEIDETKRQMISLVSGDLEHEIMKQKLKPER